MNEIFTLALIDDTPEISEFSQLLSTYLMVNDSSNSLSYSLPIINNFTERDFIFWCVELWVILLMRNI